MNTPAYLNYDRIARDYNQRYPESQQWERGQALLDLAKRSKNGNFLEVGSGTGYWLNLLNQTTSNLFGLDYSFGMIQHAKGRFAPLKLLRGSGISLPYRDDSFDLLYSVDAIHHFGDHRTFVDEAFRVLKPGGAFATIGHDPHEGTTKWYAYEYFDGVYDTDLRRYPSGTSMIKWMKAAGFENTSNRTVEHILNVHVGEGVLRDPFLKQNATSQLALLDKEVYDAGVERIKTAIANAEKNNETVVFSSDIQVKMFLGYKPR
ncbi:MAG TPA: class I SAM-dependent methyltransferase [Anaerolineales bacterium]|nr:class I SAM-dependent methyltransferase [Anaerolineales bacterium]